MSKIQKFFEFNNNDIDVRQQFINLTSEYTINYIETNNNIKYSYDNYDGNIYLEIKFLKTDGKGDTVIFFTIGYDVENKEFFSENCIDSRPIGYKTYDEMKNHVYEIEDRIINNGSEMPII